MDKKNTMLLTVIAVATLLVAVVGATFAYFSVTDTFASSTAAINATTQDVGTVALADGGATMHINTVAGDFANTTEAKRAMWATATTAGYVLSEEQGAAYTATVTGGANTAVYKCEFTVTVSANGLPTGSTAGTNNLTTGDYIVYLKVGDGTDASEAIDLSALGNTATRSVNKKVTIYITGQNSKTLNVSGKLTNTSAIQNYLTNLNSTVSFALVSNSWACDTVTTAGTDTIGAAS